MLATTAHEKLTKKLRKTNGFNFLICVLRYLKQRRPLTRGIVFTPRGAILQPISAVRCILENWWINYNARTLRIDPFRSLSNEYNKKLTQHRTFQWTTLPAEVWKIKFIMSDGSRSQLTATEGRKGSSRREETKPRNLKQKQTEITGFKSFLVGVFIFSFLGFWFKFLLCISFSHFLAEFYFSFMPTVATCVRVSVT